MRTAALMWFMAGFFGAPVLALGSVATGGWLVLRRRRGHRVTQAARACAAVLLLAGLLALGVPVWDATYAQ